MSGQDFFGEISDFCFYKWIIYSRNVMIMFQPPFSTDRNEESKNQIINHHGENPEGNKNGKNYMVVT